MTVAALLDLRAVLGSWWIEPAGRRVGARLLVQLGHEPELLQLLERLLLRNALEVGHLDLGRAGAAAGAAAASAAVVTPGAPPPPPLPAACFGAANTRLIGVVFASTLPAIGIWLATMSASPGGGVGGAIVKPASRDQLVRLGERLAEHVGHLAASRGGGDHDRDRRAVVDLLARRRALREHHARLGRVGRLSASDCRA